MLKTQPRQSASHTPDEIISIDFAAEGERARRVISRSNSRPTGKYPSLKMGRMIHWESQHELNAYRLLDANAHVIALREQPCVITYRLNGIEQRHYPDSLVTTQENKALWEIKTAYDALQPDIAPRTKFMSRALPAIGYDYKMVLAEDLGRQPRLRNTLCVLRLGRQELTFEQREWARRLLASLDAFRWGDVAANRYAPFSLQQACRLVLEGALVLDFDLPITGSTCFHKANGALQAGGHHV